MKRQFSKKLKVILISFLAIAAATAFIGKIILSQESDLIAADANAGEENNKELKMDALPVQAWEVYSVSGISSKWFPGTVRLDKNRELSFKTSGTINGIFMSAGMRLWAEKILATLDTSELQSKQRQLETALDKARIETYKAASNFERVRKNKASTQDNIDEAYRNLLKAQQNERTVRKQYQTTQRTLGWCEIRLAEKGVITGMANVKVGDKVEAGQNIAMFTSTYPINVTAMIPLVYSTLIVEGEKAKIRFKSIGDRIYVGGVSAIGTPVMGKYPVTAILAQVSSGVQAGTEAEVGFRVNYPAKGNPFILIPDMIGADAQGIFVYVVKPTTGVYGAVERRAVTLGAITGFGQEVTSGLAEGELVIASGLNRVKHGMKVRWK